MILLGNASAPSIRCGSAKARGAGGSFSTTVVPPAIVPRPRNEGAFTMRLRRRDFLVVAAASLLRADDRPKRDMLVRSVRPEDLEMPLSGFSDYLTPAEHF